MAVLYQSPDLQLPWSSSSGEDKRFNLFAILFLVVVFVSGFIIQNTTLPKVDREKAERLPPQLAKVILKKKEEPKPKPKPKPKEEPKPEKKPEEKKKEPPKPEEVKKAREKAKKSGLLAMKDDLAAMRDAFKPKASSQPLSKSGSKELNVNRSVITGKATSTSGGIQTAALPTSSGVGTNLEGRDVTQVDSVALGGGVVDGDEAADGAGESGTSGLRSEEQIRAVLDQNKGALYSIYNRALRKDPALQGKVTFELVIEPDGSVSSCTIHTSELGDSALEAKLVARMKFIDFGPDDVATTTTRWAIDFLPY